ncbi:hypothetical protein [Fischerella sp. PCC 9605]|nr:hypothetical protein [Fischerella sp. PCC 9605]
MRFFILVYAVHDGYLAYAISESTAPSAIQGALAYGITHPTFNINR